MRIRNKLTSSLAVAGALTLSMVGIAPANAAVGCPSGWTEPVSGICQVVVTSSATITVPSGAGTISAVIVGAGGGGVGTSTSLAAGGASGDVLYVSSITARSDGTVFAATGAPGSGGSSAATAGAGSIVIHGGGMAVTSANSAAQLTGPMASGGDNANFFGATGGATAGGAGSSGNGSGNVGGTGFSSFSAIPGIDTTIWPNNSASDSSVFDTTLGIGRGGYGNAVSAFTSANYGSGGTGWVSTSGGATNGIAGLVVLRMAAYEQGGSSTATPTPSATETPAALASTGSDASTWGVFAGVAALAGAAALGLRRKANRTNV